MQFRHDMKEGREQRAPFCCRLLFSTQYLFVPNREQARKRGVKFNKHGFPYVPCGIVHKPTLTRREHVRLINLRTFEDTVDPAYGPGRGAYGHAAIPTPPSGRRGRADQTLGLCIVPRDAAESYDPFGSFGLLGGFGETANPRRLMFQKCLQQMRTPHQQRQPLRAARRRPTRHDHHPTRLRLSAPAATATAPTACDRPTLPALRHHDARTRTTRPRPHHQRNARRNRRPHHTRTMQQRQALSAA